MRFSNKEETLPRLQSLRVLRISIGNMPTLCHPLRSSKQSANAPETERRQSGHVARSESPKNSVGSTQSLCPREILPTFITAFQCIASRTSHSLAKLCEVLPWWPPTSGPLTLYRVRRISSPDADEGFHSFSANSDVHVVTCVLEEP